MYPQAYMIHFTDLSILVCVSMFIYYHCATIPCIIVVIADLPVQIPSDSVTWPAGHVHS